MDLPKPPEDHDLKNIIDKLAQFVARNGPEFEHMTKQKQKDNPKFSFLFGGEFFNYYQYKVTTEQAVAKKQQQQMMQQQQMVQQVMTQQPLPTAPPWQQPQQPNQQVQNLQQQIAQHQAMMEQQIKQSEQNLAAQYQSLIQQQQIQIEEAIVKSRNEQLEKLAAECDVNMEDLNGTVQPIIDSCTKDAILNGKSWIFQHCTITEKHCDLVAKYLQKRLVQANVSPNRITSKDAVFELRLHLIYLMNDLLHHCVRKNASELRISLEKVVVPIFCTASAGIEEDKRQKLDKLLNLWEQNKYFSPETIEQLKNPTIALANYQTNLLNEHGATVAQISATTQQKYGHLQKQHQDFIAHLNNQLQQLQQQLQILQQQVVPQGPPPPQGMASMVEGLPPGSGIPTGIPASVPLSVSMGPGPLQIPSSAPMAVPPSSLGDPQVVQVTQMIPTPCVVGDQPPPVSAEPPPPLMQQQLGPIPGAQPLQGLPPGSAPQQFGPPPGGFGGPPVLTVSHRVLSQKRLVENTTCLELAKPSNQQLRLTCSQNNYHCLLDETFTKEFEVCTEWRWILGGKCAYFNTYGNGNIDERNCIQKPDLTCSTVQFSSAANTNYTACYVKKETSTSPSCTTSLTRTSSIGGTHSITGTSDRGNSTSITTTSDKHGQRYVHFLTIFLGISVTVLSLVVIYFIVMHLKCVPLFRTESHKSSDMVMNEDTVEQQPFLRNEVKDTSDSPPTMRHEDENTTGARNSGNSDANDPADMNESDNFSEHFLDAPSSPTNKTPKNSELSTEKSDNEEGVTLELTDVFDDTIESLQRIPHPTDEEDRELCKELFSLLHAEGLKLTQEVMTATIPRETGKSVKTLINQEKSKLKATLPEESRHILESMTEHDTSIHVSYGLHRIILDEEKSPKSGWGNPVRETDTGIGDDVERLYRIQIIVLGISNPVTVSVESYIRLLDIMIKALIRLDPNAEFKEDYKLLSYKLKSIKNPNLTQTMLKTITDIVKKIW